MVAVLLVQVVVAAYRLLVLRSVREAGAAASDDSSPRRVLVTCDAGGEASTRHSVPPASNWCLHCAWFLKIRAKISKVVV